MEFTLYTKAQILDMLENGFPEGVTFYAFNPAMPLAEGRIYMVPINNVPVSFITDENVGYIGIKKS
jgi:hypothetical protein